MSQNDNSDAAESEHNAETVNVLVILGDEKSSVVDAAVSNDALVNNVENAVEQAVAAHIGFGSTQLDAINITILGDNDTRQYVADNIDMGGFASVNGLQALSPWLVINDAPVIEAADEHPVADAREFDLEGVDRYDTASHIMSEYFDSDYSEPLGARIDLAKEYGRERTVEQMLSTDDDASIDYTPDVAVAFHARSGDGVFDTDSGIGRPLAAKLNTRQTDFLPIKFPGTLDVVFHNAISHVEWDAVEGSADADADADAEAGDEADADADPIQQAITQ
jgi:hypothetical protein